MSSSKHWFLRGEPLASGRVTWIFVMCWPILGWEISSHPHAWTLASSSSFALSTSSKHCTSPGSCCCNVAILCENREGVSKKKKCFSKNWIPIWPNGIIFQQPRFPGKNMGSHFPSNLLHFRVRSYEIAIIWSERKHENTPSFSPRSWSFHQISLGIEKKLPHQGKPNLSRNTVRP